MKIARLVAIAVCLGSVVVLPALGLPFWSVYVLAGIGVWPSDFFGGNHIFPLGPTSTSNDDHVERNASALNRDTPDDRTNPPTTPGGQALGFTERRAVSYVP